MYVCVYIYILLTTLASVCVCMVSLHIDMGTPAPYTHIDRVVIDIFGAAHTQQDFLTRFG
jgi:hypothetical protein